MPATDVWEFVPIRGQPLGHLGGWPVYPAPSGRHESIGMIRQDQRVQGIGAHHNWLQVRLPSGLVGWTPGTYKGTRVMHLAAPPPPRPRTYGWQRARGHAKNYNLMLEKRREQLRQIDLAASPLLLEEWYELIKELDAVLRYGFRSEINPPPSDKSGRRKRAHSFLGLPQNNETQNPTVSSLGIAPAATAPRRKRAQSFSALIPTNPEEITRDASAFSRDAPTTGDSIREQRRQLLEQERATARAVAESMMAGGVVPSLMTEDSKTAFQIEEETQHQLRLVVRERALRAVAEEKSWIAANDKLPSADQTSATTMPVMTTSKIATSKECDVSHPVVRSDPREHADDVHLSPDDLMSAEEMTMDDIVQLTQITPVTPTAKDSQNSKQSKPSSTVLSPEISKAMTSHTILGDVRPTPTPERAAQPAVADMRDAAAALEAAEMRHAKAVRSLQRLRSAAAAGIRSKQHIEVLQRKSVPIRPVCTDGPSILPGQLKGDEAAARLRAHAFLLERATEAQQNKGLVMSF